MARYLNRDDALQIDLRWGFVQRARGSLPRLPKTFRQLKARGAVVPATPQDSRGAVAKFWIAKPSSTAAYVRYLEQGKGLDGQDAPLFGAEDRAIDPRTFAREAARDPHQYRLIVSVVDGDRMDLTSYTQRLMRQVERDLLGPVDWLGATHHDTAHVHTHLMIRGRDPTGQALYIYPRYLGRGVQARAQMLATEMLGPLSPQERQQERQRTKALEPFVADHVRQTKKEDVMDDPYQLEPPDDPRTRDQVTDADGTPRTLTPAPFEEALRDEAAAPLQDRNGIMRVERLGPLTLSDRIAALKARTVEMVRAQHEERDRGVEL